MEKICCFLEEAHADDERMPTDFRTAEKQNGDGAYSFSTKLTKNHHF